MSGPSGERVSLSYLHVSSMKDSPSSNELTQLMTAGRTHPVRRPFYVFIDGRLFDNSTVELCTGPLWYTRVPSVEMVRDGGKKKKLTSDSK